MPLITLFTAPKQFTNPHIAMIQRNAILSWMKLGPEVEVAMVGNETGMAEFAAECGVRHLAQVRCNAQGTPLVSSIFRLGNEISDSPLLAYSNADILFLPDLLSAARKIQAQVERFLVVGQRWDLDVTRLLDLSAGWEGRLAEDVRQRGKRHRAMGSDYFIYPRGCFERIPDFAIGRSGWDNWMIYEGRRLGLDVIDASEAITVIHQNHDYSHLPNNEPPYRLPETTENIRLAGGMRSIFLLRDANRRMTSEGRLVGQEVTPERVVREVELFPLVRLHSAFLGQVFYSLFHPQKGYLELRAWLAGKIKGKEVALPKH
ncbi:MAG TPA: hypothetical protein VMT46_18385 [Anaerolineaceae bacterium]|nr:hypothetical protein [Anaerolineaceae bacterium]